MQSVRSWAVRVIGFGLLAGVAGVWLHSASEAKLKEEKKLPRPVVNTHVLMERFHEDYYEALHEAIKQEPADRAGWRAIEHNAVRVAEASNLVAIREVPAEKKEKWLQLTAMNQQAAMDLYAAARAKKFEDAKKAYAAVIESCNACHKQMDPDEAPILKL